MRRGAVGGGGYWARMMGGGVEEGLGGLERRRVVLEVHLRSFGSKVATIY